MKKIILLVASILTAIQTIANRSVERTNSNPLVLSSSDGNLITINQVFM